MTLTQYNYDKAINAARLHHEIVSSSITVAISHVDSTPTSVSITMKDVLSPLEKTALDSIVDAHVNIPLPGQEPQIGEDNTLLVRPQSSPLGWSFQLHGILYSTCTEGSAKQVLDNTPDPGYLTEKFYDENGVLLSGLDISTKTCQTVIEWEPDWDYFIAGGIFHQRVSPSGEIILNVTAVPDIPAQYGGSIHFISSADLNFIGPDAGLDIDGGSSQFMKYDPYYHTNKLRFSLHHPSGLRHGMYIGLKIYKKRD